MSAVVVAQRPRKTNAVQRWAWRHRRMLFFVAVFSATVVAGLFYVFQHISLPPDVVPAETTFLYDASGKQLAAIDGGENRVNVPLKDVPQVVQDAIVAREDRTFYSHRGVDPIGIARAGIKDLVAGKTVEGGSTITQQYVKNTYVGTQRTILRKIREAAISVRLESELEKDQILERYLNTIYFGRGAYGVSAASRAYFNKDLSQLKLDEAAYLAALISQPSQADAYVNEKLATSRRNEVLGAMHSMGKISKDDLNATKAIPVKAFVIAPSQREPSVALGDKGSRFFVEQVRLELERRYGKGAVLRGGLRVKTTLDSDMQAKGYDAVYGFLKPSEPAGALVSINQNGEVVSMVGGRNWKDSKVNLAMGAQGGGSGRQAGSTFKVFMLADLVRQGYSVQSTFAGPPKYVIPKANSGRDYEVSNYSSESFGSLSVVDATVHSVNTIYAQIEQRLGPESLVKTAKDMGITSPLAPNYSLVLGSAEVSPFEMASAYSTLANNGVHIEPHLIREVRTADGRLLGGDAPKETRVLSERQARIVNYVLQQVVRRGTGTGAAYGGPAAGKTGTTSDYGDAWFVGYTPTLTTAVWMGDPHSRTPLRMRGVRVAGGTFPARLWHRYMAAVALNHEFPSFGSAPSLGGDSLSGYATADSSTTSSIVDKDTPITEPSKPTTIPPTSSPTTSAVTTPP